jgi:hypothetical protein
LAQAVQDLIITKVTMMNKHITLISLLGLASFGFADDCVTMKFLGTGPGRGLQMSYNGGDSFKSVFGGVLRMKLDNQGSISQIMGYCADVKTRMANGATCVTPMSSNALGQRGAWAAYLLNKYAGGVLSETNDHNRNDKGMALQLVVWEALTEESEIFNLDQGSFRARAQNGGDFTSAQQTLINEYLNDQGQGVAQYYKSALDNCEKPASQSILAPVPEPATLGALAIGVLAALRRRKNRA